MNFKPDKWQRDDFLGWLDGSAWLSGWHLGSLAGFGLSPLPLTVANEGLGWDPLLKM